MYSYQVSIASALDRLQQTGHFHLLTPELLLQLHDELIYEVSGEEVLQAAIIVKEGMEKALGLSVPTPVRIKVGTSWGELQDFHVEEHVGVSRVKTREMK